MDTSDSTDENLGRLGSRSAGATIDATVDEERKRAAERSGAIRIRAPVMDQELAKCIRRFESNRDVQEHLNLVIDKVLNYFKSKGDHLIDKFI